ncbi:MAG: hypothetical protein JO023_15440, partial [Chloroflexi bacterium]|nr:hypothetical protein [Chloroflexota bacterium]
MTDLVTRTYGLEQGTPALRSVGPITFGPEAILFVADNSGAAIYALDVSPWSDASTTDEPSEVDHLDARLAAYLGCPREDVHVRDLAVRPGSQQTFLSVMRGSGRAAIPLILTLSSDGEIGELPLADSRYSRISLDDAPAAEDERLDIRVAPEGEETDIFEVHGVRLPI